MPALAGGAAALALVVTDLVPLSTVIYVGLFGGMMLMHLGGHGGHGGHAGHGGRADIAGPSATPDGRPQERFISLSGRPANRSPAADDQAATDRITSEAEEHDQDNSHACH